MKMSELVQKYLKQASGSYKYQLSVGSVLREAIVILGNPDISLIDTVMIDEYTASISPKLQPSSVNRKLTNVHSLLKYAHDRDMIVKMPKFSWGKEDNERVRWLSDEEQDTLLSILNPEFSAFCELLIHTGMRRGELLSINKDNVDGNYIRLWKTKTGKARSVPLSKRAQELVEAHVPFNLTEQQCTTMWNKAKKQMGLEHDNDFVLHTLRHTTATRMLKRTGNIALVQRMLGHSKITTTMRYAHIADDQLLAAVQ
jgi:integrase